MPWVNIAANAGQAVLGSIGSRSAARRQREALDAANRLLGQKFEEGKQLQLPYYQAGTDALSQLMQRLPDLTAGYDPQRLTSEPGYEFGRAEGQRGLELSLAARGLTNSGAALKRAARYGNDYATTKLDAAFNRDRATRGDAFDALLGLSRMGQSSGTNIASQGNAYAGSVADNIIGKGNAAAANDMAQGNIWGDLLGSVGANGKKLLGGSGTGGGITPQFDYSLGSDGQGGYYGNEGRRLMADGGAVRVEPKVGTRGPVRQGSGGGGLSREAVLNALDTAWGGGAATRPEATAAPGGMRPGTIPRVELAVDRATRTGFADGGAVSYDPTEGQSFGENALQGVGQGMATLIRTFGGRRVAEAMGLPGTADEAALLDAALLRTPGGTMGSAIGQSLPAAVAAPFVPLPVSAALALAPTMANRPGDPNAEYRRRVRDYSSGGAVRSGDGGKADTVPARLSGGEHVIDAEVVAMLGDGNTEAGHALLDELKRRVREFKRQTAADRPAPAMG